MVMAGEVKIAQIIEPDLYQIGDRRCLFNGSASSLDGLLGDYSTNSGSVLIHSSGVQRRSW